MEDKMEEAERSLHKNPRDNQPEWKWDTIIETILMLGV